MAHFTKLLAVLPEDSFLIAPREAIRSNCQPAGWISKFHINPGEFHENDSLPRICRAHDLCGRPSSGKERFGSAGNHAIPSTHPDGNSHAASLDPAANHNHASYDPCGSSDSTSSPQGGSTWGCRDSCSNSRSLFSSLAGRGRMPHTRQFRSPDRV